MGNTPTETMQKALSDLHYGIGQYDNGDYFIIDLDDDTHDMNDCGKGYENSQELMERLRTPIGEVSCYNLRDKAAECNVVQRTGDTLPSIIDIEGWLKFASEHGREVPDFVTKADSDLEILNAFVNHSSDIEFDRIVDTELIDEYANGNMDFDEKHCY